MLLTLTKNGKLAGKLPIKNGQKLWKVNAITGDATIQIIPDSETIEMEDYCGYIAALNKERAKIKLQKNLAKAGVTSANVKETVDESYKEMEKIETERKEAALRKAKKPNWFKALWLTIKSKL